jgi:hypothetical protein
VSAWLSRTTKPQSTRRLAGVRRDHHNARREAARAELAELLGINTPGRDTRRSEGLAIRARLFA